jgi:hypothetical protein
MNAPELYSIVRNMLIDGIVPEPSVLLEVYNAPVDPDPDSQSDPMKPFESFKPANLTGELNADNLQTFASDLEKGWTHHNLAKEIFFYALSIIVKNNPTAADYLQLQRALETRSFEKDLSRKVSPPFEEIEKFVADKILALKQDFVPKFQLPPEMGKVFRPLLDDYHTNTPTILAVRLDKAFEIYNAVDTFLAKGNTGIASLELLQIKQNMLIFMKTVLDVQDEAKISGLMAEREKFKTHNPEFIPNRQVHLTHLPPVTSDKKAVRNWQNLAESELAKSRGKALTVTEEARVDDKETGILRYTPEERDRLRAVIHEGVFVERQQGDNTFVEVDTLYRTAHHQTNLVAYTLNKDGELTLFDHKMKADLVAHSTMNAAMFVASAGEMRIEKGKLTLITMHSGHYQPTDQNVFELLKYLKEQKVDLTDVMVRDHLKVMWWER